MAPPTPLLSEKTLSRSLVRIHPEKQIWIGCLKNIGAFVECPDHGIPVRGLRCQMVGSPVIGVNLVLVAGAAGFVSHEACVWNRVLHHGRLNGLGENNLSGSTPGIERKAEQKRLGSVAARRRLVASTSSRVDPDQESQ